jgi:SAM-dependent methyltransferase
MLPMLKPIAERLIQLNAEFYQTFASQFSDTRQRLQPGVRRILDSIDPLARILDLGCGNGELSRVLVHQGFTGQYVGLDFSEKLLDVARQGVANQDNFRFIQGDLAETNWPSAVIDDPSVFPDIKFTMIFAFAALHHLPGHENRLRILRTVRELLSAEGRFIHSNWQFLNSERLRKRVHPWREIGLQEADVDPGDYLIDWRRGGFGLRYVHHFSEAELKDLAARSGFRVVESFYSDGETGDLGLYQVWEISSSSHT